MWTSGFCISRSLLKAEGTEREPVLLACIGSHATGCSTQNAEPFRWLRAVHTVGATVVPKSLF